MHTLKNKNLYQGGLSLMISVYCINWNYDSILLKFNSFSEIFIYCSEWLKRERKKQKGMWKDTRGL